MQSINRVAVYLNKIVLLFLLGTMLFISGCANTSTSSSFSCGEDPIKETHSTTGLNALLQALINLLGDNYDEEVIAAMDRCDIEFIGWYMSMLEESPNSLTYFDKKKFERLINEN